MTNHGWLGGLDGVGASVGGGFLTRMRIRFWTFARIGGGEPCWLMSPSVAGLIMSPDGLNMLDGSGGRSG